jgi:hypothetical protein
METFTSKSVKPTPVHREQGFELFEDPSHGMKGVTELVRWSNGNRNQVPRTMTAARSGSANTHRSSRRLRMHGSLVCIGIAHVVIVDPVQ